MIIENIFNLINKNSNTRFNDILFKIFKSKEIQQNINSFKLKNDFETFKESFEIFYKDYALTGIRPKNNNFKS